MQSIHHRIAIPALIMAAALATGQAVAETTTIKVPFSFKVAGDTFPAGDYRIRHDDRGSFVTLAAKDSSQSFTSLIGPGAPSPWEYKIALKFDLVGQTHLLQSIQYGTMITGKLDKKALESERGSLEHSGGYGRSPEWRAGPVYGYRDRSPQNSRDFRSPSIRLSESVTAGWQTQLLVCQGLREWPVLAGSPDVAG